MREQLNLFPSQLEIDRIIDRYDKNRCIEVMKYGTHPDHLISQYNQHIGLIAIIKNDLLFLELLVDNGMNLKSKEYPFLYKAIKKEDNRIIEFLLKHQCNVSYIDDSNKNILHLSCMFDNIKLKNFNTIYSYFDNNNINALDNEKNTAMHYLIYNYLNSFNEDNLVKMQILLNNENIDVDIKNSNNESCLSLLESYLKTKTPVDNLEFRILGILQEKSIYEQLQCFKTYKENSEKNNTNTTITNHKEKNNYKKL